MPGIKQKLFLAGLILHFLFAIIISYSFSGPRIFEPDSGFFASLINEYSPDSGTYLAVADDIEKKGLLHLFRHPDPIRTPGYPLLLWLLKCIFGEWWYSGVVVFNIVAGALLYPITYSIGRVLLKESTLPPLMACIALVIFWTFLNRTTLVMTELPFTTCFLGGLLYSLRAAAGLTDRPVLENAIGVLLIAISSTIRPVLGLYPIVHGVLLFAIAGTYNVARRSQLKRILISSTVLVITCNLYSMLLYYRYDVFTPSEVVGINCLNYTVHAIAWDARLNSQYWQMRSGIDTIQDWVLRDRMRMKAFKTAVTQYPKFALLYWGRTLVKHFAIAHYDEIVWLYYFWRESQNRPVTEASVTLLYLFEIVYWINFFATISCGLCLIKLFSDGQRLFSIAMLMLIFYFMLPTALAIAGPRIRIPIEPFILMFASHFWVANTQRGKNRTTNDHK